MDKIKVLLVISSLGPGGAEKVVSLMANYWAEKGSEIEIITFEAPFVAPFFFLSEKVKIHPLGLKRTSEWLVQGIVRNLGRTKMLRTTIQELKPDVILSFIDGTNVVCILASLGLSIPLVAVEVTNPEKYSPGPIWSFLRRLLYRTADHLVVLTDSVRKYFIKRGVRRISIIPNPVSKQIHCKSHESFLQILGVGRLGKEKGFDLLIEAFSRLAKGFSQWRLHIAGEGSERETLEKLIRDRELVGRVFLPGLSDNVDLLYAQSDLFILSSRFEGIPCVLIEAMANGLPVIACNCSPAIPEIIQDRENGLLVPPNSVAALTTAMERLLSAPDERIKLGKEALKVQERYSVDRIMPMWENVIQKAMNRDRTSK